MPKHFRGNGMTCACPGGIHKTGTARKRGIPRCAYCGEAANTKDHVFPRCDGGKMTVNACGKCNAMKAFMTPLEFVSHMRKVLAYIEQHHTFTEHNADFWVR